MIKESDKMIKAKAIEGFSLEKFDELKNIVRSDPNRNQYGHLYENDVFECNEEMAKYLMGDNKINKVVVKIIEIIPEKIKEEKKTSKKKNSKK